MKGVPRRALNIPIHLPGLLDFLVVDEFIIYVNV